MPALTDFTTGEGFRLNPALSYQPNPLLQGTPYQSQPQRLSDMAFRPSALDKAGAGLNTAGSLLGTASKLGSIGKIGGIASKVKGATPWGAGGLAASALGNAIAKKHAKTGGAISGAGKGAATGAMIGSVVPGIGTAVGGIVGGLVGGIKGFFGGKKKEKEKKALEAGQAQAAQASDFLTGHSKKYDDYVFGSGGGGVQVSNLVPPGKEYSYGGFHYTPRGGSWRAS